MINLANTTYFEVTNATTEIVSAAANTDGIILHMCGITCTAGGEGGSITQNAGDIILDHPSISGFIPIKELTEKIFIPAGRNLEANGSTNGIAWGYYEVLS